LTCPPLHICLGLYEELYIQAIKNMVMKYDSKFINECGEYVIDNSLCSLHLPSSTWAVKCVFSTVDWLFHMWCASLHAILLSAYVASHEALAEMNCLHQYLLKYQASLTLHPYTQKQRFSQTPNQVAREARALLVSEPTHSEIDQRQAVLFMQNKCVEIEQAQWRCECVQENNNVWHIIKKHDMPLPEGEKLTNRVMATFLRKQKAHHPGLQIGKMRWAELIARICSFASATPHIETPPDDEDSQEDTDDDDRHARADYCLLSAFRTFAQASIEEISPPLSPVAGVRSSLELHPSSPPSVLALHSPQPSSRVDVAAPPPSTSPATGVAEFLARHGIGAGLRP
jgi:hypothetical protein